MKYPQMDGTSGCEVQKRNARKQEGFFNQRTQENVKNSRILDEE